METENELVQLRGQLIAHGFILRCLLMNDPEALKHIQDDLARTANQGPAEHQLTNAVRQEMRRELETLASASRTTHQDGGTSEG